MPSPLCGYASPAASPTRRTPSPTGVRGEEPRRRYACPGQRVATSRGILPAARSQSTNCRACARQAMGVLAAEADVQVVPLAEAPAVAPQVGAEEELGRVAADRAGGAVQARLDLLGGDDRLRPRRAVEEARHGTEVSAGSDHHRSLQAVVRHPLAAAPLEPGQGLADVEARAGALEQVAVELAPPDAVAHRLREARLHLGAGAVRAEPAGAEAGDRLQRPSRAVVRGIDLQDVEHGRRDPAGARLVAREAGLVEHHDVEPRAPQAPRATRSGRTAAYDECVQALRHAGSGAASAP